MDEMAIRQHVEFEGNEYFGYVDMGNVIEHDNLHVAKEVLTFMVVSMNDSWKVPVGYFIIDGLNALKRASLVQTCLKLLHTESGVQIHSLTFDGVSTNFAMSKHLGCDFSGQKMKTWFQHELTKQPVNVLLDPCHMLKLVRNTLGDKETLKDPEGNVIRWSYITSLHKLQESEGVHLANKLKSAHVQWYKQKMKVRLAAQTFSNSVADAIVLCHSVHMQEFEGSEATVKFIRLFNRLFDVLNSANKLAKDWKAPISAENLPPVETFLSECEEYIRGLKACDNTSILSTQRKTGFLGFLICIQSVRNLINRLLSRIGAPLRYLLTYKLSQDHLEMFFGIIRSKGGFNNNPTARQFIAAYKRILLHNELTAVSTGNCMMQDLTALPVVLGNCGKEIINHSSKRDRCVADVNVPCAIPIEELQCDTAILENASLLSLCDHDYCLPAHSRHCTIPPVIQRAVVYIAGWVVFKLTTSLKCEECLLALISTPSDEESPMYDLIRIKSRGRLIYPSKDVIDICLQAEHLLRSLLSASENPRSNEHSLRTMILAVTTHFVGRDIFEMLRDHMFEQSPVENHVVHLVREIARIYIKVRMHHAAKLYCQKMHKKLLRQKLTKTIIFSGQ